VKTLRKFLARPQNWAGTLLLLLFIGTAAAAPWLSPMDPKSPGDFKVVGRSTDNQPHPPGEGALLGTLPRQYDVFHTLVWGTRAAFRFGLTVSLCAFLFGVSFGAIAGYAGGTLNSYMMRFADAFLTVPILTVTVFLQQIVAVSVESLGGFYIFNIERFGRVVDYSGIDLPPLVAFIEHTDPLVISLILFSWMPYARLVNSLVLSLKQADYVAAARALGAGPLRIIRRHILPHAISPALVVIARDIGYMVILQATFTFIGIGGGSPWGTLLSYGRNWVIGPGTLAVVLFGVTWNLLGDGLNDLISMPEGGRASEQADSQDEGLPSSILQNANRLASRQVPAATNSETPPPVTFLRKAADPAMLEARQAASRGELKEASRMYIELIFKRTDLEVITADLIELARLAPEESTVWIALGDALTRSGKEQDGLKAYAQARRTLGVQRSSR
jgi:peptide/nickel transport system permease protein